MRQTTSTMLQQNNNNNYPCLNMSGSPREMLQKCSRASLPFPSRLELGLGDLPLIRGLRAWALCSKNRRKAGGLPGRGQVPTAPPAGRGSSTSCPRPADVYLSGEWGRTGYGLPLGLDARQAGIGALVTVATLKTSLGSGKTQTQCLFLRTEKGSCLYSTAKPSSGVPTSGASSMVGEWLRGRKSGGGGGKDAPAARRDSGPTPSAQTGANRVRVRSGRRWRKSGNAAQREKQQRSWEDPAGELAVEERQEEQDKAGLDRKRFPSLQQDSRRARCCPNVSPKTSGQYGRKLQRKESQEEHEGGESLGRGVSNRLNSELKGMQRERQKNEEEEKEEEEGGLSGPNPDEESDCTYKSSCTGRDVDEGGEMSGAERNEGPKTRSSHIRDGFTERHDDTSPGVVKKHTGNNGLMATRDFKSADNKAINDGRAEDDCCEEVALSVNGFSDHAEADQVSEEETESPPISSAVSLPGTKESSAPAGGSVCTPGDDTCRVQAAQECEQNPLEVYQLGEDADIGFVGKEDLNVGRIQSQRPNFAADENNTVSEESSKNKEAQTDGRIPKREDGELWSTNNRQDDGKADASEVDDNNNKEVKQSCASKDERRLQEDGDASVQTVTCVQLNPEPSTDVHSVACADPPTSVALSLTNPTPSLPPLASMATGLPCLEAEKEEKEEEEVVREAAGDGGENQREKRRFGREQGEEERGSNVATEEGITQEEEKEEEDDEFGVFMQAEGELAWSEEVNMSASVPCGSRERIALGSYARPGESAHCTAPWEDSSFHQSDDTWTAFSQDASHAGQDAVGQWWPTSAVEARRDRNPASVFAEAFPSLPGPSAGDSAGLDAVPTLTQLLRGRASQDQGLLDTFHDLNRMIGQRYKRASGVSRDLLLRTLHLEPPHVESRPGLWTTSRRLSPGLPSANQHAQTAAAKRRLSYDYNRNIVE